MADQKNLQEIVWDFELQNVENIKKKLESGLDPNSSFNGKLLRTHLLEMYNRGSKFKTCLSLMIDAGMEFDDEPLLSVLLDDSDLLGIHLGKKPDLLVKKYSIPCAFTSLTNVSLLHICAEYNHVNCASLLLQKGANPNEPAGLDLNGFGGHTPIFHTVTQYQNICKEVMDLLLVSGAKLDHNIKGLMWGAYMPWETLIPCVNPVSYAMMGHLPQFHRSENVVAEIVTKLMKRLYKRDITLPNIPNKYLAKG